MIRFIHTADWQIGMRAAHVPDAADSIRQARLDVVERIGKAASDRDADFVIVAGDVFENSQVDSGIVHELLVLLGGYACDVYLLPGNHDFLSPGSVYESLPFRNSCPVNVHVIMSSDPIEKQGAVILPSPAMQRKSGADPTACMKDRGSSGCIRIGVAHGSLMIEGKHKPDAFPIPLEAARTADLDYLALGHWHSFYRHDDRTVYSGSPEPTAFDEKDSGNAVLVTVREKGAVPDLEKLSVGSLCWRMREMPFDDGVESAVRRVKDETEALDDPSRTLLRLKPVGRAPVEAVARIRDLRDWLKARVLYVDLQEHELLPLPTDGLLEKQAGEHPLIRSLLADLSALLLMADPSLDVTVPEGVELLPGDELRELLEKAKNDPSTVKEAIHLLGEALGEGTA